MNDILEHVYFAYLSTCLPASNSPSLNLGPQSTWFTFPFRSENFLESGLVSFLFCMFGLGWAFKGCIGLDTHNSGLCSVCNNDSFLECTFAFDHIVTNGTTRMAAVVRCSDSSWGKN